MKRRFDPAEPELMDRPQPVSAELETDLENLRQLNQWFGSHRVARQFCRRWIPKGARIDILDVATGSGDLPRLMVDHARAVGAEARVLALDQQGSTIAIAQRLSMGYPEITFAEANALEWSPPHGFDIVHCSLALHHFSEAHAVTLLARLKAWSRGKVLVTDLRRGLFTTAGVYLLTSTLFRAYMTQVDARLSAERAFSFHEFRQLAERGGWRDFQHRRFACARQAIWLEQV